MVYTYSDNYAEIYGPAEQEELIKCGIKIESIFQELKKTSSESEDYKVLHPIKTEFLPELEKIANHIIRNFSKVVIIGMGGAILNPKLATSLKRNNKKAPEILFLDTIDPYYFNSLIDSISLGNTYFLLISKSGRTVETLSLLGAITTKFEQAGIQNYKNNFCFITQEGKNPLRSMAEEMGALILDHEKKMGGRFSTFTNINILPGLIAGLDMRAYIKGANEVINDLWVNQTKSLPVRAAISTFLFEQPILVNIAYLSTLSCYLDWYSQMISESLGKDGKGYTPVKNIGPNDQHSMFQLYLGGPTNKLYTFLYISNFDEEQDIPLHKTTPLNLSSKTLGEISNLELNATLECFKEEKLPLRTIALNSFNEECLGALAMHSIIEIIILGKLININPFGQPSVEKIKNKVNMRLNAL